MAVKWLKVALENMATIANYITQDSPARVFVGQLSVASSVASGMNAENGNSRKSVLSGSSSYEIFVYDNAVGWISRLARSSV